MGIFEKERKPILFLLIFFAFCAIFSYAKMVNVWIDFGTETYYPKAILDGGLLYRDIIVPFGPFSYLYNAFLLKIFGISLNVYYISGTICAFFIVFSLYFISRQFLNRAFSVSITAFTICSCAFVPHLMNYITPYSYAMTYGLCAFLFSVLSFLLFLKNENKYLLYFACLTAGIAISSKYEFFLYAIFLAFLLIIKKTKIKNLIISSFLILLPLAVQFLFLFAQGLTFEDLIKYTQYIKSLTHSKGITDFYQSFFYFDLKNFLAETLSLLAFWVFSLVNFKIIKTFEKVKTGALKIALYGLLTLLFTTLIFKFGFLFYYLSFSFLPIFTTILFVLKIKDVISTPKVFFLVSSSIILSIKSFMFLSLIAYGRFFLPLLLLSSLILLINYYIKKDKAIWKRTFAFLLICLSIFYCIKNIQIGMTKTETIKNKNAIIKLKTNDYIILNTLINYVNETTTETQKIVVLPAPHLLNFLTDRKPVSKGFLEIDDLISVYAQEKPEVIIIVDDKKHQNPFGIEYTQNVCRWVEQNYRLDKIIKTDSTIFIFRKM